MPHKKFPPNAQCPCGSGQTYGDCGYEKRFEYLVDEDGTIFKSKPVSNELAEIIKEQKRKFQEEHGREIGPDDKLFFDAPPLEHAEHFMVEAMKKAGLDPALIYAFEKTGFLVTEENQHLLPESDLDEWEAAIEEYDAQQGIDELTEEELPADDGDELFSVITDAVCHQECVRSDHPLNHVLAAGEMLRKLSETNLDAEEGIVRFELIAR